MFVPLTPHAWVERYHRGLLNFPLNSYTINIHLTFVMGTVPGPTNQGDVAAMWLQTPIFYLVERIAVKSDLFGI